MRPETELEIRRAMTKLGHPEERQDQFIADLKVSESKIKDRFPGIEFHDYVRWFAEPYREIDRPEDMIAFRGVLYGCYGIGRKHPDLPLQKDTEFMIIFGMVRYDHTYRLITDQLAERK